MIEHVASVLLESLKTVASFIQVHSEAKSQTSAKLKALQKSLDRARVLIAKFRNKKFKDDQTISNLKNELKGKFGGNKTKSFTAATVKTLESLTLITLQQAFELCLKDQKFNEAFKLANPELAAKLANLEEGKTNAAIVPPVKDLAADPNLLNFIANNPEVSAAIVEADMKMGPEDMKLPKNK